nr:ATPase subunit 8 [Mecomma ambulans]
MPQMAPIWWSMMFLIFILTYFMVMIMVYFSPKNKKNEKMSESINKTTKLLNWKW